jgi:hypothetical protein
MRNGSCFPPQTCGGVVHLFLRPCPVAVSHSSPVFTSIVASSKMEAPPGGASAPSAVSKPGMMLPPPLATCASPSGSSGTKFATSPSRDEPRRLKARKSPANHRKSRFTEEVNACFRCLCGLSFCVLRELCLFSPVFRRMLSLVDWFLKSSHH